MCTKMVQCSTLLYFRRLAVQTCLASVADFEWIGDFVWHISNSSNL